jgi:hypothetical protein
VSIRTGTELDQRDQEILAWRTTELDLITGPREGDYVEFANGITRRVSHVWGTEWDTEDGCMSGVQTTEGGSFYLGNGHVSYSGSLYQMVPMASLTDTWTARAGSVWIFHHDHHTAHNGIAAEIPFRVYKCSQDAPRS